MQSYFSIWLNCEKNIHCNVSLQNVLSILSSLLPNEVVLVNNGQNLGLLSQNHSSDKNSLNWNCVYFYACIHYPKMDMQNVVIIFLDKHELESIQPLVFLIHEYLSGIF